PKELPTVLRTLGQWMSKLRRMTSEFQNQFQEAMREAEMADLKKQVDEMTSQAQSYANFDPVGEVRREVGNTQQQNEGAMVKPPGAAPASPPGAAAPPTPPGRAPRRRPGRPGMRPPRPRRRRSRQPPMPMPPSPMASPHEPRGRRDGDRGE